MNQDLKSLHGESYAARFAEHEAESGRMAALVARIPIALGAEVLDAGCGSGLLARLISDRVRSYHGVDFSEAFVRRARESAAARRLHNCAFYCTDIVDHAARYPAAYDHVLALDLSEHVPDAQWKDIVEAMRDALKPGGKLTLHTPNLDFVVERMKAHGFLLRQFPQHVAVRTLDDNRRFFERAGFTPVDAQLIPHYNVLRVLHPMHRLPLIGRLFGARILMTATKGRGSGQSRIRRIEFNSDYIRRRSRA